MKLGKQLFSITITMTVLAVYSRVFLHWLGSRCALHVVNTKPFSIKIKKLIGPTRQLQLFAIVAAILKCS